MVFNHTVIQNRKKYMLQKTWTSNFKMRRQQRMLDTNEIRTHWAAKEAEKEAGKKDKLQWDVASPFAK